MIKVYIVTENYQENIIRFATLRKDIAEDIDKAFPHLGLKIHEIDLIGTACNE